MLPKKFRLPANKIRDVLKMGFRINLDLVQAAIVKSQNDRSRFAIIVSKSVSKLAVTRNRCKRLLREEIRLSSDSMPNIDCVFVVKKDISKFNAVQVEELIQSIVSKIR
jgi:ribonuclease P protein component